MCPNIDITYHHQRILIHCFLTKTVLGLFYLTFDRRKTTWGELVLLSEHEREITPVNHIFWESNAEWANDLQVRKYNMVVNEHDEYNWPIWLFIVWLHG